MNGYKIVLLKAIFMLYRLPECERVCSGICSNHEAAANMSVICSLLVTCKAHDVNPRDYLNDVIARMPYHKKATHEELLELLPHKWKLQHPESALTKQEE